MINKLEYYICLFLYSLKDKKFSENILFRYVYIFVLLMTIWETMKT